MIHYAVEGLRNIAEAEREWRFIAEASYLDILSYLLERGVSPNIQYPREKEWLSPLHLLLSHSEPHMSFDIKCRALELLLDHGADLDCLDAKGRKPDVYIELFNSRIYTEWQTVMLRDIIAKHRSTAGAKTVAQARSASLAPMPVSADSDASRPAIERLYVSGPSSQDGEPLQLASSTTLHASSTAFSSDPEVHIYSPDQPERSKIPFTIQ